MTQRQIFFSCEMCVEISSSTIFRIWGPIKIPSFILDLLRKGNVSARYANAKESLSKAFTNCLNKPTLICKGGKYHFAEVVFV